MTVRCLAILLFLASTTSAYPQSSQHKSDTSFTVTGYLPEYRIDAIDPSRLTGITHLIYFSIEPSADGTLPSNIIPQNALDKLHAIKRATQCKLLLCIGGWGRSDGFPLLAADKSLRRKYIREIAAYLIENGFSGIDYDWEHPRDEKEKKHYRQLVADTRKVFDIYSLEISIAQASWQDLGQSLYKRVDRINLMSYDHEYPQATLAQTKADALQLIAWGCPPKKVALGVPFYGRDKSRQARTYSELVSQGPFDPNQDLINGYAFNGKTTIEAKIDFAREQGLSGIMIWELAQDSIAPSASLLQAIRDRLAIRD